MNNIDCEYMCAESHSCCHPNRSKGWRKLWHLRCLEETITDVKCELKRSLWDMLKEDYPKYHQATQRPGAVPNMPNRPPAPPSKRVYKDNVRVYNTDDKFSRE